MDPITLHCMIRDIVKQELLRIMLLQHIKRLCELPAPLSGEPIGRVIRRVIVIAKKPEEESKDKNG